MSGQRAVAPPHPASVALELRDITHRFGSVVALRDASLTVHAGTIHALVGENGAGKTTLMRVAYGMIRSDAGTIAIRGEQRRFDAPADAIASGIGMVHQHYTLVPAMTVADNLALGGRGRYSREAARHRARELSEDTGFRLDPDALAGALSIAAQQRVEIAKALAREATILVLDEPTGVLAPAEVDDLLRWLRAFARRGNAVVLITHKLREALAVADDVTVLRHGSRVWSGPPSATSDTALSHAMLGDAVPEETARATAAPGVSRVTHAPIVFRARDMHVADDMGVMRVRGASFEIAAGELVGVAGVDGSGQRELLRALAGRIAMSAGSLDRPADVGFVPEDRHHDAVLLDRTLVENVTLRGIGRARGRIDWAAAGARTRALMTLFDVRAEGPRMRMSALSGGNQQRLVLARELGSDRGATETGAAEIPELAGGPPEPHHTMQFASASHRPTAARTDMPQQALVLENPTRGLDIRAAADIRARVRQAAADGTAVVWYSSDLDEVLALASRVLVAFDGTVREPSFTRDAIGRAMVGLA